MSDDRTARLAAIRDRLKQTCDVMESFRRREGQTHGGLSEAVGTLLFGDVGWLLAEVARPEAELAKRPEPDRLSPCPRCNGKGHLAWNDVWQHCSRCGGTGKVGP